nr:hypothetical protein [Tanacetum cinerariifolium]
MQEFWVTAKLHQHSIRFKMDTRKSVLNLEAFREMLHISPRIPSQSFAELPFEEEILEFLRHLRHSDEIRHLTDVNINKLYQPWRSFSSVINKCLTGKSYGIDSFRLSQAQILWGFYHRSNVDYAYLIWEDFVHQHQNQRRVPERKKGDSASSTTPPTPTPTTTVVAAPRLSVTTKNNSDKDDDDNDDEEELAKNDNEDTESGKGGDEVSESEEESDEEETRQEKEESFDLIPRTPEGSEDEGS